MDLTEVWDSLYPKMTYIDRLLISFPAIEYTLEAYLWANIELNIMQVNAKDFKKAINERILSVLRTNSNTLQITKDTITGLDFMYYALLQEPIEIIKSEIPSVPKTITAPKIIEAMIKRYRNY